MRSWNFLCRLGVAVALAALVGGCNLFNSLGYLQEDLADASGSTGSGGLPDPDHLTDAVAISAGGHRTCALRESGRVVCWGGNQFGELGLAPTMPEDYSA